MADLVGQNVVITGSGGGLGAAYARGAAALGAKVVVNDINREGAERVAADICRAGGAAVAEIQDVRDPAAAQALIQRCISEFGSITGLVNNAALIINRVRFADETVENLRALLDTNVVGVFNCARAAIGPMLRQGRGTIVNVTSGSSTGQSGLSTYGATKGAVSSFTYAWASELAGSGVRVNAISPMAMTPGANNNPILPPVEGNVPPVMYLLSDLSQDLNGQIVRIVRNKLSIMGHPANRAPVLERESWSLDSVAEAFRQTLAANQVPTNVATYDIRSIDAE